MARRRFYLLPLIGLLLQVIDAAAIGNYGDCKCFPGSACWPGSAAWQQLNASVEGRLLTPRPSASACYNSDGSYSANTNACQVAISNWTNPFWRGSLAGAMMCPNWESSSIRATNSHSNCPLLNGSSCKQGAVPVYAVQVEQVSDVQAAVAFASAYNLRLTIKNTGSDYLGRSMAEGSFGLWMHTLTGYTFNDSFTPDGCSGNACEAVSAVTVAAGVQWKAVYEAADALGKVVVGGMSPTVGAGGGFIQGGGHGPLSPLLGMAADHVLQFTVVTADAEHRTANAFQNNDLFWALRGGGGGTFGVVTSVTYKTHPALSGVLFVQYQIQVSSSAVLEGLLTKVVEVQVALSNAGAWSGYQAMIPSSLSVTLTYMLPNGSSSVDDYTTPFQLLTSYAEEHSDNITLKVSVRDFPSLITWHSYAECLFSPGLCSDPAGENLLLSSRLFPKHVLEGSSEEVGKALATILLSTTADYGDADGEETPALTVATGMLVAGRAVAAVPVDFNAVAPAFRRAIWHLVLTTGWEDTAKSDEVAAKARAVTDLAGLLRKLTPVSGSYLNEADVNEPSWQQSFFQEHYPRLRRIKDAIDPTGLFLCTRCVGSEDWTLDLTCRVSTVAPVAPAIDHNVPNPYYRATS